MLDQMSIERTGSPFTLEGMHSARQLSWTALEKIASQIHVGMTEKDAQILAETTLTEMGCTRKWHRTWIRFGVNTLKPYGVLSEPNTMLKNNDLFFLDLGPIWNGFEGDVGKTFAVGSDPEQLRCKQDVETIFHVVKEHWKNERASGKQLYDFAQKTAENLGWHLSLNEANGHRLCDFPHALHHKGPISALDFTPSACLWVLEIQIRHPSRQFGAFYEDLLV